MLLFFMKEDQVIGPLCPFSLEEEEEYENTYTQYEHVPV